MSETDEKRAPVQGFSGGIPWSMHLRAYDAYCKKYGPQPALIDLEGRNCRGGFGDGELDEFIPGWREEVSEISRLQAEIEAARAQGRAEGMEAAAKIADKEAERRQANRLAFSEPSSLSVAAGGMNAAERIARDIRASSQGTDK